MESGLRRGWQVATAVMLLTCLFMAWQSLQLSLFDRLGPGPGFFPFWLSAIGVVMSAAAFAQAARRPAGAPGEGTMFPRGEAAQRVAAIFVCISVAALLLELLGFQITVLLFALALPAALGDRRWLTMAIVAVAGSFGVFYVFTRQLDVMLPPGLLGN